MQKTDIRQSLVSPTSVVFSHPAVKPLLEESSSTSPKGQKQESSIKFSKTYKTKELFIEKFLCKIELVNPYNAYFQS
jgi:hypothetical protein